MPDIYSYILAELLKRNYYLHGEAILEKYNLPKTTIKEVKVINGELRAGPHKSNGKLKAISGQIWGWIRTLNLDTRQIYQLILQWALHLTNQELLYTHTDPYRLLLESLRATIESGSEGEVEDVDSKEILAEWQFVQEEYFSMLHNLCTQLTEKMNVEKN